MRHIKLQKYRPTICLSKRAELLLNEKQVITFFLFFFLHANVFLHVKMVSAWAIYFTQFSSGGIFFEKMSLESGQ